MLGVVDVGSNSVHLLVARVAGHEVEALADESVFLGLRAAVGEGRALGPEGRSRLVETLTGYCTKARDLGASEVALLGTEPIRRAADAPRIVHEAERVAGAPLHVLGHEEEAYLTAIGVTAGRRSASDVLVVDVGGGSTELVLVAPDRPPRAWGLRLGSAQLTELYVSHDPPTAGEIHVLRDRARYRLASSDAAGPVALVAVGGTASNLVRLLGLAGPSVPPVGRPELDAAMAALTSRPAAEIATERAINPRRTPILAAGVAILEAILDRYGLERLTVSEAGIREGAALALVRAGAGWRDHLPALVAGWRH